MLFLLIFYIYLSFQVNKNYYKYKRILKIIFNVILNNFINFLKVNRIFKLFFNYDVVIYEIKIIIIINTII